MFSESNHDAKVDSWIQSALKDISPLDSHIIFAEAIASIWRRALITLGDTTMEAIADRVLSGCKDKFPWLDPVSYRNEGFCLKNLVMTSLPENEVCSGLRCLLLDILNLLGALTGETLTPQLLEELAKVGVVKKNDPLLSPEFKGRITSK